MDKNAIKKYAVWARNELIARVTQKAGQYEITEKKTTPKDADSIGGRLLTEAEKNQRKALIEKIEADGFEQVMEEVAYTWFNRFTALRFMEVNNYLPSHTRVFTNESGEFKPQILADAIQLDLEGLNMDKVFELKEANKTEELYKYLLITQCNALSAILPRMFQKIEHYTELLLPDYLLREGSVIEQMIALIPEEDWTDQVQIIGWLYQFYMAEPKDRLINARKQYADKDIATVTELFTPDWIVRYMVENALGRFWLNMHYDENLRTSWKYYLESNNDNNFNNNDGIKPEDILAIDPCQGSGHILAYMFDVLVQIYVVYIYHDTIDEASHTVDTMVFPACDDAIQELKNLTKIICNDFGATHILFTADHGFLYTYSPLTEDDKIDQSGFVNRIVEYGRRFAIMMKDSNPDYLQKVEFLGGNSEYDAFAPKENVRIKKLGGGLNFVHGGISLQEMVVPVIDYHFLRNQSKQYQRNQKKYDTKLVEVSLLSATHKVSNMIFSLNFYQKEPVGDNREAATYQLYFTDSNGKQISDIAKIIADKTSDNGQERTFRCSFNLKSLKYDNKEIYYLVIADADGLVVSREEFQIDIAFAVDEFDFFS